MLAAHQRQFDLVLNVLDVEGAACVRPARDAGHDLRREVGHDVMDASRSALTASFDR